MSNAERRARQASHLAQPGAVRRGELAIEQLFAVLRRAEQVAVDALEVAVDALARHDALDAVDRGGVAVRGEPRAALAVQRSSSK